MSKYSKLAWFIGGTLFGSVGFKVLSSKEAKNVYVKATAMALRAKESVMETVTEVQENASDILASAKDLNAELEAKEAAAKSEAEIKDEADTAAETEIKDEAEAE